jgi:hypothetical protein
MEDEQTPWSYNSADFAEQESSLPSETITWEASEYIAHEKPASWYGALFGASLLITAVVYLLNRDILTSVAIMTVSICAEFFASRKPGSKRYVLSAKGLEIDGKLFKYSEFRSFSIVEEGAIDSIWLKPLGKYKPAIIIYFSPEEEDKIATMISNFLPHEQRELDAIDRASRRLRF